MSHWKFGSYRPYGTRFYLFETYKPASRNKKITIANGTSIPIGDQGDAKSIASLLSKNVVHVPKLPTNLIYVHQLKILTVVLFSLHHCVFQERGMGRRIGTTKKQNRISKWIMVRLKKSVYSCLCIRKQICYWCNLASSFRLGHPSFPLLQTLFLIF